MAKKKIPELIIEHLAPESTLNCLSLLEHRTDQYLVIIDNIQDDLVTAYVLDYAIQEGINLEKFMEIAQTWAATGPEYPLSFELSKLGVTSGTRNIYKTFDLAYVTRLVGRAFTFDLCTPEKIRRRRATNLPETIDIRPVSSVSS